MNYLVKYKLPNSDLFSSKMFWVRTILILIKHELKKSLRIEKNERLDQITDPGFLVSYDPTSDGNCQLSEKLLRKQRFRQRNTIRTFQGLSLGLIGSRNAH